MKSRTLLKIVAALTSTILFTSCHKTQFSKIAETTQASLAQPVPIPVDPEPQLPIEVPPVTVTPPAPVEPPAQPTVPHPEPVVVVPPPKPPIVVVPQPVQKSGKCASNSSTRLLSCLNCDVPMNPPLPPQFSEKGQSLIDVMTIGCSVPNKSAPKNYVPPTKDQLIARLSRLSPSFYPDSQMSSAQKNVIAQLINDPAMQAKMFGGRWYQPPYSDAFETYFGASVAELVYQICYQSPEANFSPYEASRIQSAEYMNCMISSGNNCKEKNDYVAANKYRQNLRDAMKESINNPYVAPAPTPAKKCNWESFEGNYEQGAKEVLARWLVSGFKVGIEIGSLAGRCEAVTALPSGAYEPRGPVKIAGYICR